MSNVFQICRHMHIHRSCARGDQVHLGQRMRGPVGPRLETLSTSVPGSAVRTAERRTRLGRDAISMRAIGNRPVARTDGSRRLACSRARAQKSSGTKRSLIHSERDQDCDASQKSPHCTQSIYAGGNFASARTFLRWPSFAQPDASGGFGRRPGCRSPGPPDSAEVLSGT